MDCAQEKWFLAKPFNKAQNVNLAFFHNFSGPIGSLNGTRKARKI